MIPQQLCQTLDGDTLTAILKEAAKKRGIEKLPRAAPEAAHQRQPQFDEKMRQEVLRLWNDGLLINQITERVGLKHHQVQKIIAKWHRERGLPIPDGRRRRKELEYKGRPRSRDASSMSSGNNQQHELNCSDRMAAVAALQTSHECQ